MIFEHISYRTFLHSYLAGEGPQKRPLTLRAFAKHTLIAPSTLSSILNGRKKMSSETALRISSSLKLSDSEREYFFLLVDLESTKSMQLKDVIISRIRRITEKKKVVPLSLDVFKSISDWYHFAILELTQISQFQMSERSIAKALGISWAEAKQAVERLKRLDLLEINVDGKLVKTRSFVLASTQESNLALRSFHQTMLRKASEALEAQSPDSRFVGSETFAFNSKDLKKAEAIIEDCFTKLIALSGEAKNKNQVFHAGIQFFSLTPGETK